MKDYLPNSDPLYDKVISALETVRPYLQVDGGQLYGAVWVDLADADREGVGGL